jgi:CRP-like cAMP-binding protein
LLQEVKFFKERSVEDAVLKKIAKLAVHEYIPQGKFVFKQGDTGDRIYVIIDGEVSVCFDNNEYTKVKREMQSTAT